MYARQMLALVAWWESMREKQCIFFEDILYTRKYSLFCFNKHFLFCLYFLFSFFFFFNKKSSLNHLRKNLDIRESSKSYLTSLLSCLVLSLQFLPIIILYQSISKVPQTNTEDILALGFII